MFQRFLIAASAIAMLTAVPARAGTDFQVKVDADFWEDWIEWDGGLGRAYDFRWLVIEQGGKLAVCGVGYFNDPTTRNQSKDLMRKAKVLIDGKSILTDISFFATVKKGADLTKATATCRMTRADEPRAAYKIRLAMDGRARF